LAGDEMTTLGPIQFIGGLNTKASALTVVEDQYVSAQDINIKYGDILKRKGSVLLNASAFGAGAAFTGLFDWQTAAGQRYLVGTAGTSIGQMADLGGTFTDITGAVTITTGANNQSTFAALNNILVRCGSTTPDTPIQWTGTGNAAVLSGSPPVGNICDVVNNFMFISGVAATPSRVFWSNVIDPQTWGAANYVDFRKDDGDKVTALDGIGQNLIIFKRRSVGVLSTTPPSTAASVTLGPLYTLIVGIGCVGPLALDNLPDGRIVFFGPNAHLYVTDGFEFFDISDPKPPKSNIQPTLDALNIARLPYSVVRVYPNKKQIWLAATSGTGTTNNIIYVYDYELGVWVSSFANINANCMVASIDTRAAPIKSMVLLTGNYSGSIYEQDRGNTNPEVSGTTIDGYVTKSIQLSAIATDFNARALLVPIETQGAYNLEINIGFNGLTETPKNVSISQNSTAGVIDQFTLDTSTLGGATLLRRTVLVPSVGRSSSIQIQFRNRLSAQDFTVHPFFIGDTFI
jgi:hypothetical protein